MREDEQEEAKLWEKVASPDGDTKVDALLQLSYNAAGQQEYTDEVMDRYKTNVEKSHSSYSLDDHAQLLRGENVQLFAEFRRAMLALDPCVSEVFLKLYVAYKAETNFVDVIPKAKGLRLTLNLSPHELDDPKEISKDISDKGRWGNGDVSVNFNSIEELPYIVGLVRQSFEKQMGAGIANG